MHRRAEARAAQPDHAKLIIRLRLQVASASRVPEPAHGVHKGPRGREAAEGQTEAWPLCQPGHRLPSQPRRKRRLPELEKVWPARLKCGGDEARTPCHHRVRPEAHCPKDGSCQRNELAQPNYITLVGRPGYDGQGPGRPGSGNILLAPAALLEDNSSNVMGQRLHAVLGLGRRLATDGLHGQQGSEPPAACSVHKVSEVHLHVSVLLLSVERPPLQHTQRAENHNCPARLQTALITLLAWCCTCPCMLTA